MDSIVQLILGVILGGIASYLFPLAVDYLLINKTKQKILGVWVSSFKPKIIAADEWVIEELEITKDFFRGLKFEGKNNSGGFNWVGFGRVKEKRFIVGEWQSTNPGAYASGVLILTIAARGNFMFGYDAAPDESGTIIYREFALGKTAQDLEKAKQLLTSDTNKK